MDDAAQTIADGASTFFVSEWVPVLLDVHTWIAMLVSWALVESIKQFGFVHKQPEAGRKDRARVLSMLFGYAAAYIAYSRFLHLPDAYILALALGILNPWIYLLVGGILDSFGPTKKILDFVKPHRRHKFVPLPKENPDDVTTFTRIPEDKR